MLRASIVGVLLAAAACVPAAAQTSYPMLTQTYPIAVQRGKSAELMVFAAQPLTGASKALVEGAGVSAEIVKPKDRQPPTQALVRFEAARDAALGPREFRLLTPAGLSSLGQALIVEDPVIAVRPDALEPTKAMPLPVPAAACGRIAAAEQSQWLKFEAKAGQTLVFEVVAARLEDKVHDLQKHLDPLLTLCDENGRELAACDDFLFADPLLVHTFKKAGTYLLQIRDAKYDGDPRWSYALKVSERPFVLTAEPWAVRPDRTEPVRLHLAGGGQAEAKLDLGEDERSGWRTATATVQGYEVAVPVFVSPIAAEPKAKADGGKRELAIPSVVSGVIEPGRPHQFRFRAKAGQTLRFEVQARRYGQDLCSQLDATLQVRDAKGTTLQSADDDSPLRKDPTLLFTAPADGDYELRLADLFGKGGPGYAYVLEAARAEPDFELRIDGDKANLAPGASAVWFVQAVRKHGFAGAIEVKAEGLPEGISAQPLTLPPGMTQGALILSAAADAKPDAKAVRVFGVAEVKAGDGQLTLTRTAVHAQEIYLPGGGRGRFDANLVCVAAVPQADLTSVEVEPRSFTLKPGEEVTLKVKLKRRPEAAKATVTLDVRLRHLNQTYGDPLPPGVVLVESKSKTLLGQENEGALTLRAGPNAVPVKDWPLCVTAYVSINFVVKVGHSSPPLLLTVEKP